MQLTARPSGPLKGEVRVPGDKSISHRALILGALAEGVTEVSGLLEGADVLATAEAYARLRRQGSISWPPAAGGSKARAVLPSLPGRSIAAIPARARA